MSHGARLFHTAFLRQPPYPAPPGPAQAQFTPAPPVQFAPAPSAARFAPGPYPAQFASALPSVRPASGLPPAQFASAPPFLTPLLKRNHGYPPGACPGGTSLTYPASAYPARSNRSHASYSPNPPAAPLPGRQPGPADFGMVGPAPSAQASPYFTGTYSSVALPSSSGLGAVLVAILILVVLDLVLVRPYKHQHPENPPERRLIGPPPG
ncbi:Hypothetical protein DEACI_2746 [Acididesulfobacillus acetoxydans]|uniref:Uncharacterized protein n=1 Tax=Acididesulfobacillus acetoxydans TaxID=1561005 RepID=A0A8S0WPP8_9FIRM|nr:hypothetical protein [Acididesulfobacillus acetoxydans]CAA7602074.1 Hypothetical protein DEACI_2746 [Acididesulfobacillus acetoxydans]CEJ08083.1 Hypothetical protein DEACI_2558 [Acididesulfobacillus acetoxydans]